MYFYWHSLHFNSHTWLNVRTRKLKSGLSDKDWLQKLTPPRPWWLWLILWNAVGLQQKSQNWSFAWCLRSVTYSWANRNEKIRTETKRFEPKRKDSYRNEPNRKLFFCCNSGRRILIGPASVRAAVCWVYRCFCLALYIEIMPMTSRILASCRM